jgi:YggT family protein
VLILANLLSAIAVILQIILQSLLILVGIRVILSWVNPDPYNPIVRFVVSITDPLLEVLKPLRRYLNPPSSRIDFMPFVLVLIIIFLQYFLVQLLIDYSAQLRLEALYTK